MVGTGCIVSKWVTHVQGCRRGLKDGRVHVVVNQYFATKFLAGPMLESQKLVVWNRVVASPMHMR